MAGASSHDIVTRLNGIRRRDYPTYCESTPDAWAIESLGTDHVAVLAVVSRWGHRPLDEKVGAWTVRQLIAESTGLSSPGRLEKVLADLAADGLIKLEKQSGLFSSKVTASWSRHGADICFAYLNSWGWELLSMALEQHRLSDFAGGPPIVGGPGVTGWSSSDR